MLRDAIKTFIEVYRKTRALAQLNAELERRVALRTAELEAQTERLRHSEERRSIALSAGDMSAWEIDLATGAVDWDDGSYRIFGVDRDDFQPTVERIEAMIHPDDRERSSITATAAAPAERFRIEYRILRPDGEMRWCYAAGVVSRDSEGKALRINGVTVDVTDRKRAEERQLLLSREVDHRAKNMLAVVISVLRLTKAKTTAEFISTVEGRIHALAATHNLLSATRWEGANLRRIVDEEMAPYRANHRERVITEGPDALLQPATAQSVALALHELATNAARYGALSTDNGTLRLTWSIGREALELDWREAGGPPAKPPASLGFGLSLVRSSIEAQFRGGVEYDWQPEGLRCRLKIPRAQIVDLDPTPPKPAPSASGPLAQSLAGKRLLLVEDEFLVGTMTGKLLQALGATVIGPHARLADSLAAARHERFDGAVLDFNLAGESAEPLADLLIAHGVPFVFLTGYQRDSVDKRYTNVPLLEKPIEPQALERILLSLLDPAPVAQASTG